MLKVIQDVNNACKAFAILAGVVTYSLAILAICWGFPITLVWRAYSK